MNHIPDQPSLPAQWRPSLAALCDLSPAREPGPWITGGTLRDLILGIEPQDVDLTVSGGAFDLGRKLAQTLGGHFVPLKAEFAACRVVLGEEQIDLNGLRAPDLDGDLRARDFTINALAWDLADALAGRAGLIDPTGGLDDLGQKLIRPAGPGVLAADPLRVLRAFRFMSGLGFSLAQDAHQRLARNAPGLAGVPKERVAHEWLLFMAGTDVDSAVAAMERAGVLTRLVPVLERGRGVEQNPYHHLDILGHNLACLASLAEMARRPEMLAGPLALESADYMADPHRRALLATAALMHDAGKPTTREPSDQPGWATFYRHDTEGAKLTQKVCRDLGLSKRDSEWVARLVREHMRPFHLLGAEQREGLSARGVRRLLVAAGEDLPGYFLLAMADTLAGKGPLRPLDAEERLLNLYARVASMRDRELAKALASPPLLTGHELMAGLGISSGPIVGRLLRELREAQLDGRIASRQEALKMAALLLDQSGSVDSGIGEC